jgi:[ribosomal protein S5]-alanine N-acetyltransferase
MLETDRLVLRPLSTNDAADIFLYCSNPNLTRFTLWNTHETLEDTMLFIREYLISRYQNQEPDPIGIVLKDDPTRSVIGSVGCFWASQTYSVMELGYNLAEPYWGRGIIVEASRRLLDYVFREFAVARIQARILAGNTASTRVAQKLGMRFEGILRSVLLHRGKRVDVEYHSILSSEWALLRN